MKMFSIDQSGFYQMDWMVWGVNPAGNYMFKVNNSNTRARCEICSKLTIKTPERCHGVVLVPLLLTLNILF